MYFGWLYAIFKAKQKALGHILNVTINVFDIVVLHLMSP